jgi:hypothetical protein
MVNAYIQHPSEYPLRYIIPKVEIGLPTFECMLESLPVELLPHSLTVLSLDPRFLQGFGVAKDLRSCTMVYE